VAKAEYRPAIDGLRAIAILAVFLFHLNRRWLPGGFVGVDIFFVISGYLITSIIFRDCERERFSFRRFYQRRIARLLAAFFFVAAATLAVAPFIYSSQDLASAGATLSASAAFVANLKFMLQGNYFVLSPDAQPFAHCWSLSVEEQFYLLYPATFFLLYRNAKRCLPQVLAVLCAISLVACIAVTRAQPAWAFYLLPTRAWELLAGASLATVKTGGFKKSKALALLPFIGLALTAASLFIVSDGPMFPGYLAALPVAGTACFLTPYDASESRVERLLSWGPLVLLGRMSYSLYLWHWPVFSLVDYGLYRASPFVRLALKVSLSLIISAVCFAYVERPSRIFLNQPDRRRLAFGFLGFSLLTLTPIGIAVRDYNHVSADMREVAGGGLRFNEGARGGSMVLMGDSDGSMYGKMAAALAQEHGLKLIVLSVDGGDPLPYSTGPNPQLWLDSLAVVHREKPDFLVLACKWLNDDQERIAAAVEQLRQLARLLILITEPPVLPPTANREAIRDGRRPPFFEDPATRAKRDHANAFLKSMERDNVIVVDIENLFSTEGGAIRFLGADGDQLYQDSDHLSGAGTNLVKPTLIANMLGRERAR
jgi:peptidoglycan/LPS O-acetylase OafA/YrhL